MHPLPGYTVRYSPLRFLLLLLFFNKNRDVWETIPIRQPLTINLYANCTIEMRTFIFGGRGGLRESVNDRYLARRDVATPPQAFSFLIGDLPRPSSFSAFPTGRPTVGADGARPILLRTRLERLCPVRRKVTSLRLEETHAINNVEYDANVQRLCILLILIMIGKKKP